MLPISICAICKDEEQHLEQFLSSIRKFTKGYPVELLIVDTGSTDESVKIAQKYADTILSFEWIHDFSAARNYAIDHARYEWVLFLDCDEYLVGFDMDSMQEIMSTYPENIGMITRKSHTLTQNLPSIYTDYVMRLFPKSLYHYEGKIHEQVFAKDHSFLSCFYIPLEVEHVGYIGTQEELLAKSLRNKELLLKELEQDPNNPYLCFQLGQCCQLIQDNPGACDYFQKGIALDPPPNVEYTIMMVEAYGYLLLDQNRTAEALELLRYNEYFHMDAGYLNMIGCIYLRINEPLKAAGEFVKATSASQCRLEGANTFIPRYNLGLVNELLGDTQSALTLYRACGTYPPAQEKIAQLTAGIS